MLGILGSLFRRGGFGGTAKPARPFGAGGGVNLLPEPWETRMRMRRPPIKGCEWKIGHLRTVCGSYIERRLAAQFFLVPESWARGERFLIEPCPVTDVEHTCRDTIGRLASPGVDEAWFLCPQVGFMQNCRADFMFAVIDSNGHFRAVCVECDGAEHHAHRQKEDARRDAYMKALGFETWRFTGAMINRSPAFCIAWICHVLTHPRRRAAR